MTPKKCIERGCPRKAIDGKGIDVCVLYQVSEKKELAVLDVFNVTDKQCKMLRKEIEEKKRFGEPKQIYFEKLEQKNERK